jgi:TRAP-type C4-dicarboxylate transport system substrate-binding protein
VGTRFRLGAAAAALLLPLLDGASAQDLPRRQFKAIGLNGPTVASTVDEIPFWRNTIPQASNGAITVDITPLDQMGIDDKTMLRLLRLGVMDFASMDISKMAGDDARFEGCDLAGLTLDVDKARAACRAWAPVIDRQMQRNWNAKLLAIGGNPPQVFWCRSVIGGLGDLRGKKIRVINNTMRDFLQGIGGTAVNMAFAEVVPALNNGVVDCAVTGSLSGNTAGWTEVTRSVYPMSLGWSINVLAVNLNTWNGLTAAVQSFLLDQVKAYEDKMWETVTFEETGYEDLYEMYRYATRAGQNPIVVDAMTFSENPVGVLRTYCERLGVPFEEGSLSWAPGEVSKWKSWEGWHDAVQQSTGIQPAQRRDPELPGRLMDVYERCLPYYYQLAAHVIQATIR